VATHKSAEKRARQSEKRRVRNRAVRSHVKTRVARVRSALAGGDAAGAAQQLRDAERVLRKAASQGVIPVQRASRTVARLAKAVARSAAKPA
jgi:small subunit ribosomal protein S20